MSKQDAPPSAQPGLNDDPRAELKHILHAYWAVRVLDNMYLLEHLDEFGPDYVPAPYAIGTGRWAVVARKVHEGDSPDAVRIIAAEFLVKLHPELAKGLEDIWPLK